MLGSGTTAQVASQTVTRTTRKKSSRTLRKTISFSDQIKLARGSFAAIYRQHHWAQGVVGLRWPSCTNRQSSPLPKQSRLVRSVMKYKKQEVQ